MINEKFGKAKAETSGRGKHIESYLPDGALDYVVIREEITHRLHRARIHRVD